MKSTLKKVNALVIATVLTASLSTNMYPFGDSKVSAADEYFCRDFYYYGENQHYMEQYNTASSEHFQIFWGNNDETGIVNDNFIQMNLEYLEKYYDVYINDLGMIESSESIYNPDGNKYKTNVYLTRTGLPHFAEGWAFQAAEMYTGYAYLMCEPLALVQENG